MARRGNGGPYRISIPAPARGATVLSRDNRARDVFQFPPLREGRPLRKIWMSHHDLFQFPPLREGRRSITIVFDVPSKFQFPPLREGRPRSLPRTQWAGHFNSRPCARGDLNAVQYAAQTLTFQFPPLREGRRGRILASSNETMISIPAPARGATKSPLLEGVFLMLFQFPPLREGRPRRQRRVSLRVAISIPAPARGATRQVVNQIMGQIVFQFPPLREGRPGFPVGSPTQE